MPANTVRGFRPSPPVWRQPPLGNLGSHWATPLVLALALAARHFTGNGNRPAPSDTEKTAPSGDTILQWRGPSAQTGAPPILAGAAFPPVSEANSRPAPAGGQAGGLSSVAESLLGHFVLVQVAGHDGLLAGTVGSVCGDLLVVTSGHRVTWISLSSVQSIRTTGYCERGTGAAGAAAKIVANFDLDLDVNVIAKSRPDPMGDSDGSDYDSGMSIDYTSWNTGDVDGLDDGDYDGATDTSDYDGVTGSGNRYGFTDTSDYYGTTDTGNDGDTGDDDEDDGGDDGDDYDDNAGTFSHTYTTSPGGGEAVSVKPAEDLAAGDVTRRTDAGQGWVQVQGNAGATGPCMPMLGRVAPPPPRPGHARTLWPPFWQLVAVYQPQR